MITRKGVYTRYTPFFYDNINGFIALQTYDERYVFHFEF